MEKKEQIIGILNRQSIVTEDNKTVRAQSDLNPPIGGIVERKSHFGGKTNSL